MAATHPDSPLVGRQELVDQVIDRLLRPDDVRESPKSFVQPGFHGVAGIGKSRLLHAIAAQALTVTPYVVAFDFDRRRAADMPGTPWGLLLRLIDELAAIDHQRRHWWRRHWWRRANPFRDCKAIIAQTGAPTAISQSLVATNSTVQDIQIKVESLVQPIPPNVQKAFTEALARLGVHGRVRRESSPGLGAKARPLIVILLDTVETAPAPIREWLADGLPELLAGNTLHFHAVVVAAGRQQVQNLIATDLPALTPAASAEFLCFLVNDFTQREEADRRFAHPAVRQLLCDDTPTRRTIIDLADGIPLLLQILADLVADDLHRPLASPNAPLPEGRQARIDYVVQHYVERIAAEAPGDADRAQRRRLLLYNAVPRRIPNDGLLYALFHDLPGVPGADDSGALFNRLSSESFVRAEPSGALLYHALIRDGFLHHLEQTEPQRWRELHRRAAAWWETLPDAAETLYHRLRADYAATVDLLRARMAAALDAQDWPLAQTLIGAAGDLALQPVDLAWLTLFKAELAWGEGNLPLAYRRVARLQSQPDLPPDLAERLAADLERWFHFAPDMNLDQVQTVDEQAAPWLPWYAQRRHAPQLQAHALYGLGDAARMQARYADAVRHFEAALTLYQQIPNRLGEANALLRLGDAARMQDRYADAVRHFEAALTLYQQLANHRGEANALLDLGHAARMQARYADAVRHFEVALTLSRQIADRLGEANALLGLGHAARMQARYADAVRHYEVALTLSRQIANHWGEANALWGLGDAARMQARYADAVRHYEVALTLSRQIANHWGEANALWGLGEVARMQARYPDAVRHFEAALTLSRQIADHRGEANALLGLGHTALEQARYADAVRHFEAALTLSRQIADRLGEANALLGLGHAARMQARYADAVRHFEVALTLSRQIANHWGEANALWGLGEVARMQARYADAVRHFEVALTLSRQIANHRGEAYALWGLGDAAGMQARFTDARSYLAQAFDLYDAITLPTETLRFAIFSANAALDQAHTQQAVELARWLLSRAEQANAQCDPAVAWAYTVRLQALRVRIDEESMPD